MAKVTQVTNHEEHMEMLDRIIKCSLVIANPLTDDAKKTEYLQMYDGMVLKVQRYQRMTYIKTWPDLRRVYTELGWEFDEPAIEKNYAAFLDE